MLVRLSPDDFPANPLEKSGYTLDFHDEFDGPEINSSKWIPYYLPHWSSRQRAAPRYAFEDSNLVLQITTDQPPWCPEFDGLIKCSSIQTGAFAGPVGSAIGQHRFNRVSRVREAQPNVQTYVPQYGYFEIRARAEKSSANHVALWMIGFEDQPERSAEIAICEIMGAHVGPDSSRIGYGVHPWADAAIQNEFYEEFFGIDATRYHVYAAEWTPTHIDFYIDNVHTRTIYQSPRYPMQFMLSLYERPDAEPAPSVVETAYPKRFTVDYFRAYQPLEGYAAPGVA